MPNATILELPGDLRSPGQARRFVSERLRFDLSDSRLDLVLVVVSEIVTNAVMHVGSSCSLELRLGPDLVQVRVEDQGRALPVRRLSANDVMSSGRGLKMLDRICLRWGFEPTSGGKVVWADLER